MRTVVLAGLLLAASGTSRLAAQVQDEPPARAQELRQRIEDRFAARVQEELGLTDDQTSRLRTTAREYGTRRRDLEARERELRSALAGQLRPGVAADQDSVARVTQSLLDLKVTYAQTYRDEMADLSRYLTPVQRAQLFIMRERLMQRVKEIRTRRDDGEGFRRRRALDRP